MAQKTLNPVLRTRKVNSLPEDLKKIAEELLIDKFGSEDVIREEKRVAKSTDSFRGNAEYGIRIDKEFGIELGRFGSPEANERQFELSNQQYVDYRRMGREPGIDSRLDISNRQRVFTTPVTSPDFRGFREALRRFDEQNLPSRDRIFRFSPGFWNALRQDRELALYLSTSSYAQEYTIFGCRILIDPSQSNELEVRF